MENFDQYFGQGSLIFKYLNGRLTENEKQELDNWILESEQNKELFIRLTDEHELASQLHDFPVSDKADAWERVALESGFNQSVNRSLVYSNWFKYAVAAMLTLASGLLLWTVVHKTTVTENSVIAGSKKIDLPPGENKAVLTLADGSKIILDQVSKGEIAHQKHILITKTDDGQLVYTRNKLTTSQQSNDGTTAFNHISTPRGGQYNVVLPDGSKVWLNAASSLKYPTEFDHSARVVELIGEAYFEITKVVYEEHGQKHRLPFRVFSAGQIVDVLGTRFNVNSYADERSVTTTLVEGSVRIVPKGAKARENTARQVMLKPGEQARLTTTGEHPVDVVREVNMEEVIAWKNGEFLFKDADIQTIMRQISRWYDVEVEFQGRIPETRYRGKIPRNVPVSQVFEILQTSGMNFKIEGRKIIVKS